MRFAENGRISHRQLYRQMVLAFLSPFLLRFPGKLYGVEGILGVILSVVILLFYVIFVVRFGSECGKTEKHTGILWKKIAGIFFVIYIILAGAYLLSILAEIVPESLVTGVPGEWISLAAVLACSMGTRGGMQRRGRMAEVSGGVLLCGIVVMMIISAGQGKAAYLREMFVQSSVTGRGILAAAYKILCGFSALGLLPFLMPDVEKHGSAGKASVLGILTIAGISLGMLFLVPGALGFGRMQAEKYPVVPLLAGADLPGNVLARFDVVWMGFLLYGLLFAVGGLLHYGHLIIKKTGLGTGRFWIAGIMYLLAVCDIRGMKIQEFFENYVRLIFIPGLVLIQLLVFLRGKKIRKKRAGTALGMVLMCLFLGGCRAAVEPEKRAYPLALGVDLNGENLEITYGMPDMGKATGQEKGESGGKEKLTITGRNFHEIEELYNRSQEKFLDMGHLEVLVLGESLLSGERWTEVIDFLKKEPFVGEDLYVFRADKGADVVNWKDGSGASAGEVLEGLMENRMGKQRVKKVTLRDIFYERYRNEGDTPELPELPEAEVSEGGLMVR